MAELRLVSTESSGTSSTFAKRCTTAASSGTKRNRCHFYKAVMFDKTTCIEIYIGERNISDASVGEKHFLFSLKVKHSTLEYYPVLAPHKDSQVL